MTESEINEYNAEWERAQKSAERLSKRPGFTLPVYLEYEEQIARLNAEQRLAMSELSRATPNKAISLYSIKDLTLNYDRQDSFEWHGEFRRTRQEQMSIESYNKKDLV